MSLSRTDSEIQPIENQRVYLLYLYLAPLLGVIRSEFRKDFWQQSALAIVWCCLRDPAFSRLAQCQPMTDRQMNRRTDTRRQQVYRVSIA